MNIFERKTIIENLAPSEEWDTIVIGGGATGLGVALDREALYERGSLAANVAPINDPIIGIHEYLQSAFRFTG